MVMTKYDDKGRKAKLQHGRRRGRLKRKRKEVVAKREEMKEGERNLQFVVIFNCQYFYLIKNINFKK